MLQLLETGRALYVLAVFCGLGVLSRLITCRLYKGLLKESTNLAMTRNKRLKELRQKAENTYRINQGLRDSRAWLEHQLNELRFMGITLNGWTGFSMQWTWLCLLTGAAAAFASYWYRLDGFYIVMYGGGAVLMAMFSMLFDLGVSGGRRERTLTALQDYMENVMCPRLARNLPLDGSLDDMEERRGLRGSSGRALSSGLAERRRAQRAGSMQENAPQNEEAPYGVSVNMAAAEPIGEEGTGEGGSETGQRGRKKLSGRAARRAAQAAQAQSGQNRGLPPFAVQAQNMQAASASGTERRGDHRSDVDYLKQSLEQIAASRDRPGNADGDWLRNLKPEEVQLLGDILKEYLV